MLNKTLKSKKLLLIITFFVALLLFSGNNKVFGYEKIEPVVEFNPLYEISEEEKQEKIEEISKENDERIEASTYNGTVHTSHLNYLRDIQENLVQRNTYFTVSLKTTNDYTKNIAESLLSKYITRAMSEEYATSSDLGDYMNVSWKSWYASGNYSKSGNYYTYNINYSFEYYTTYEQEQELNAFVAAYVNSMKPELKSDYELIYDLNLAICENVTYDYTNLNDTTYDLKYTAYAAVANGTAVCQGYAALFYKMIEECGINARVVTSQEINHAWNIVELDGVWYNIDTTWNDTGMPYHDYFLENQSDFNYPASHAASDTKNFYNQVNMATKSIDIEANRFDIADAEFTVTNGDVTAVYTGTNLYQGTDMYADYYVTEYTRTGTGTTVYVVTGLNKFKGTYAINFEMTDFSYADLKPTSVKFSWGAIDGVDGYIVRNVKTDTIIGYFDTNVTEFTYSDLESAMAHEFEVCAYVETDGGKVYSIPARVSFYTRPEKVTGFKASGLTTNTITLKWNSQPNVKGYKIYKYNSDTAKYEYVGKTTGTSYTVKKLTAGRTYLFQVAAYFQMNGNDYGGEKSATVKMVTRPKNTTIKKLTTGSKKANLTWSRVSGANGYEIYMKQGSGSWKKIKTITNASTVKYSKTKLKKGKKYYFRIKAYKTCDGKKYYSGYSATKSITVK